MFLKSIFILSFSSLLFFSCFQTIFLSFFLSFFFSRFISSDLSLFWWVWIYLTFRRSNLSWSHFILGKGTIHEMRPIYRHLPKMCLVLLTFLFRGVSAINSTLPGEKALWNQAINSFTQPKCQIGPGIPEKYPVLMCWLHRNELIPVLKKSLVKPILYETQVCSSVTLSKLTRPSASLNFFFFLLKIYLKLNSKVTTQFINSSL